MKASGLWSSRPPIHSSIHPSIRPHSFWIWVDTVCCMESISVCRQDMFLSFFFFSMTTKVHQDAAWKMNELTNTTVPFMIPYLTSGKVGQCSCSKNSLHLCNSSVFLYRCKVERRLPFFIRCFFFVSVGQIFLENNLFFFFFVEIKALNQLRRARNGFASLSHSTDAICMHWCLISARQSINM